MRLHCIFCLMGTASAQLVESLLSVPQGWERLSRPSPTTMLKLRIAMTQPDQTLFAQTLQEISDPGNARYGQHLERDELKELLRPPVEASEAVVSWLRTSNVSSFTDDGEWISFETSVRNAEIMLGTEFDVYRNSHNGKTDIRTLEYSIPEDLHKFVDMIQPTTRFSPTTAIRPLFDVPHVQDAGKVLRGAPKSCDDSTTPSCIKELYNIDPSVIKSKNVGFMAFNNFDREYPQYKDLATFERKFAPYATGHSFNWTSINGGLLVQNSTQAPFEGNLDAQYLLSTGYPVPMLAYSTGGLGPLDPDLDQPTQPGYNEPYLDWLIYMSKLPNDKLPHTISTSYGEDEQSSPYKYRTAVCNMLGQLGARGVSVIFASGDFGVGSSCQSNDGKNRTEFNPIFPASCPYVTSVGGTYHTAPERAQDYSSGGFSNTWARPSWQDKAVNDYLQILGDKKWSGLYNRTGRAFPDVAAQSANFNVVIKGGAVQYGGTSAAAPTFAGVVALLNAAKIQAGQAPLGFLNPWIYSEGYKGLNDITRGGSIGCTGGDVVTAGYAPYVPYASWNATKGWDPVTGYGTPDFKKLLPLALKSGTIPSPYRGG